MSKLFTIIAHDKADMQPVRAELRQPHLDYFAQIMDQIAVAGPLRSDGGDVIGSLMIVKADSADDARALLANDPFAKADIFADVAVLPFAAACGDWVGGKTW
jgi:uncharacterized protein YciI